MSELDRLIRQKQELDAQIESLRAAEKEAAIADIRAKIAFFELTAADLGLRAKAGRPPGMAKHKSVAPQYRDPESGATWSGRGKTPKWIAGKDRTLFAL